MSDDYDLDLHRDETEPVGDLDLLNQEQRSGFYSDLALAAEAEARGEPTVADDYRADARALVDDRGGDGRRTLSLVEIRSGFDAQAHEPGDFEQSAVEKHHGVPDGLTVEAREKYLTLMNDADIDDRVGIKYTRPEGPIDY